MAPRHTPEAVQSALAAWKGATKYPKSQAGLMLDLFHATINDDAVAETDEAYDDAILAWTRAKAAAYKERVVPLHEEVDRLKHTHAEIRASKHHKWTDAAAKARWQGLRGEILRLAQEEGLYAPATLSIVPTLVKEFLHHLGAPRERFRSLRIKAEQEAHQKRVREAKITGADCTRGYLTWDFTGMVADAVARVGRLGKPDPHLCWALTLCSGRRVVEIADPGFVYTVQGPDTVSVNRLAKQGEAQAFGFTVLCDALHFVDAVRAVQALGQSAQYWSHAVKAHAARSWPALDAAMQERFQRGYSVHINRHVYVAWMLARDGGDFTAERVKALLGHTSIESSVKYLDLKQDLRACGNSPPPAKRARAEHMSPEGNPFGVMGGASPPGLWAEPARLRGGEYSIEALVAAVQASNIPDDMKGQLIAAIKP